VTLEEFQAYLEEENEKPLEYRLGHLCARCEKPIMGDVVFYGVEAATPEKPPLWFHPECFGIDQ